MDRKQQHEQILTHYGYENQIDHLRKECIELAHACDRYLDGKDELTASGGVIEEIADVMVLMGQLMPILGEGDIDEIMQEKIDRTLSRIEEAE